MIKTQKAQGIVSGLPYLHNSQGYERLMWFCDYMKHNTIVSKDEIQFIAGFPYFARPCPQKPRHGFVDSRTVQNNYELSNLWDEVMKQDSQGEIVLGQHYSNVDYSSVYVNSGVMSIGAGNDGATGGKNSISFPVASHKFNNFFMIDSGLELEDTVYIESIFTKNKWHMAQVRGGPEITAMSPDFIPESVEVKSIVKPCDDLLLWERLTKSFGEGTVVYAPGYTLASHAAIHCVLNSIPFVTTTKPEIGQTLKADEKIDFEPILRKQFKLGVDAGLALCNDMSELGLRKLLYYSLSVLHNWVWLKRSTNAGWVLGSASVIFSKICAAIVAGEYRHFVSTNYNDRPKRAVVYQESLAGGSEIFKTMPAMFEDFYAGRWESGFGGVPWANCVWHFYEIWTAIVKQYNNINNDTFSDKDEFSIVGPMNKTTNIAHNNGWWFNKIASGKDLDAIVSNPGMSAFVVGDIFIDIFNRIQKISTPGDSLSFIPIENAPCNKNKYGNLEWVWLSGIEDGYAEIGWRAEDDASYSEIKLTEKEYETLLELYNHIGLDYFEQLTIQVNDDGTFTVPGGDPRSIKETF